MKVLVSIVMLLLCSGCIRAKIDDLDKVRQDLNRHMQTLADSVDTLAVAVPGERGARQFDVLLNGTDEDKKKLVESYSKIFNHTAEGEAEWSVKYGYSEDTEPLQSDAFIAERGDETMLLSWFESNAINFRNVSQTILPPASEDQLKEEILNHCKGVFNDLNNNFRMFSGRGFHEMHLWNGRKWVKNPGPLSEDEKLPIMRPMNANEVEVISKNLTEAIFKTRETLLPVGMGTKSLSNSWHPINGNHLFIVIPKSAFSKKQNINIKASLHDKNDELKTINNRGVFVLLKSDFKEIEVEGYGSVMWLSRNLTGMDIYSVEKLVEMAKIAEIRKNIAKLKASLADD